MEVKHICTGIFLVRRLNLRRRQTWLIFFIPRSWLNWICLFTFVSRSWFSLRILSGWSLLLSQCFVILGGHEGIRMSRWEKTCHFNLRIGLISLDLWWLNQALQLMLFVWWIGTLHLNFCFLLWFRFLQLNYILRRNLFPWTCCWSIFWLRSLHCDGIPLLWASAHLYHLLIGLPLFRGLLLELQQLLLVRMRSSILWRKIGFEFLWLLHLLILSCLDSLLLLV